MGIGLHHSRQTSFKHTTFNHRYSHGGELRKRKLGRGFRPLSTKTSIHVVFKVQKLKLRHHSLRAHRSFQLVHYILAKYARYFSVKIEQLSIQHDHLHLLIRTTRRSNYLHFFRVVAGQIAQVFEKKGLLKMMTDTPKEGLGDGGRVWKHRPFSRVVLGFRGQRIIRNYIQLNEKEVLGKIKYRKTRLRGLSNAEWQILWV